MQNNHHRLQKQFCLADKEPAPPSSTNLLLLCSGKKNASLYIQFNIFAL